LIATPQGDIFINPTGNPEWLLEEQGMFSPGMMADSSVKALNRSFSPGGRFPPWMRRWVSSEKGRKIARGNRPHREASDLFKRRFDFYFPLHLR